MEIITFLLFIYVSSSDIMSKYCIILSQLFRYTINTRITQIDQMNQLITFYMLVTLQKFTLNLNYVKLN